MFACITPSTDFRATYLPARAGPGTMDSATWHHYLSALKRMLPDFWVEVISIHEPGPNSDTVIAHVVGRATSTTGAQFIHEVVTMFYIRPEELSLSQDPQFPVPNKPVYKVYKILEFMDSQLATTFFLEEQERRARLRGSRLVGLVSAQESSGAPSRTVQSKVVGARL
ncbi:hypothetical protein DL93DRAFT_2152318 [Clavulina sp. PMI_390]|nr:hypothetical protein DL93DRAFT_2152318 [Clavulina sp. PMI_390]